MMLRRLLLSLLSVCMVSNIVYAQDAIDTPETYVMEEILNLSWGDGPQEVGLLTEPGWSEGPLSFDVDDNGMIYVQDSVNLRILVFDEAGRHVRTFPIHGRGGSALDDEGNIYINNGMEHEILKYTPEGVLLESIEYELKGKQNSYAMSLDFFDGVLFMGPFKITTKNIIDKKGSRGETLYTSVAQRRERSENPRVLGRTSLRRYNNSKDGKNVLIFDAQNTVAIKLEFIPENKTPRYKAEDIYGNIYFQTFNDYDTRTREYWKVSSNFQLLAYIGPAGRAGIYDKVKRTIITGEGAIYEIQPEKSSLKIYKWSKK